jgi:hypothetical protein
MFKHVVKVKFDIFSCLIRARLKRREYQYGCIREGKVPATFGHDRRPDDKFLFPSTEIRH